MTKLNLCDDRYPDFGVTLEYVVSHWLVNETMKNCDSDPKRRLAKKACIDITNVDYKWARRAEFFDVFLFATGGWWEHDLRMRQAQTLVGKRSYRTSRNLMRQALVTVINYLNRPEFQTKKIYWRCSEVITVTHRPFVTFSFLNSSLTQSYVTFNKFRISALHQNTNSLQKLSPFTQTMKHWILNI